MTHYRLVLSTLVLALASPLPLHCQFVVGAPINDHRYAESLHVIFTEMAPELNEDLHIPRPITLTSGICGQANAFYNPQNTQITVCTELVDLLLEGAAQSTSDEGLQVLALTGQLGFILIHEVAHSLIDVLDLPVLGQEEDAADQFTALLMSNEPILAMWATQFWRGPTGGAGRYVAGEAFADEHDLSEQRFFNLACWTYGADPLVRGYVVSAAGLPPERSQRCQGEFEQLAASWQQVLTPHLKNPNAFDALNPARNASGYWRFMESMEDAPGNVRCTASGTLGLWQAHAELMGEMTQEGSCVWYGMPTDDTAASAISSGLVRGDTLTFDVDNCQYTGVLQAPKLTRVDGTIFCSVRAGLRTVELTGTWTAVR